MKITFVYLARYSYGEIIESVQYYQGKLPSFLSWPVGYLVLGMQKLGTF
jgi:hypothetical protein